MEFQPFRLSRMMGRCRWLGGYRGGQFWDFSRLIKINIYALIF